MPKLPSTATLIPVLSAAALTCFLSCGCHVYRDPVRSLAWNHGYTLVWSDEFNGTDGTSPDASKWTYDTGGKGWGNNELECYTNLALNPQVKGHNLAITAMHQPAGNVARLLDARQ